MDVTVRCRLEANLRWASQRTQGDGTGRALRESVGPRRKVTRASAAKEGDTYIAGDLQRELMLLGESAGARHGDPETQTSLGGRISSRLSQRHSCGGWRLGTSGRQWRR